MVLTEDNQELLRKIFGDSVLSPKFVDAYEGTDSEESTSWLEIKPQRFRIIEAGEFVTDEHIEPDWLIDEVIPARGIGMAWGASGSHKTTGLFDMMTAVHRGTSWRDKFVQRGRCVLVVAEGESAFPLRMKALAKSLDCHPSELPAVVPSPVNLMRGKDVAEFLVELKKRGAAWVNFDTLQQCSVGAAENEVKDQGVIADNLKFMARELQCFVSVTHHAGKNEDRGARGSSMWRPTVDTEMHYEFDGKSRGTVTIEKQKDGPRGAVYPFESKIIELGISRKSGKPFGSVIVKQLEDTGAKPDKTTPNRPRKGNALMVLQVFEREYRGCAPTLEEAFVKCTPSIEGRQDRLMEYFRKAVATLADTERDKWLWRLPGGRLSLSNTLPTDQEFST